jgi:hypothetical protein
VSSRILFQISGGGAERLENDDRPFLRRWRRRGFRSRVRIDWAAKFKQDRGATATRTRSRGAVVMGPSCEWERFQPR